MEPLASLSDHSVRVNVQMLPDIFLLRNIIVGLGGNTPVDVMARTQLMRSDVIYSEEDFEWSIARIISCPRCFFKLVYSATGILTVILGTRTDCLAVLNNVWHTLGHCELCCSPMSARYERQLEDGAYGTYVNKSDIEVAEVCAWAGDNTFCLLCYDSVAYVNFFLMENRVLQLTTCEQLYLTRMDLFYDSGS